MQENVGTSVQAVPGKPEVIIVSFFDAPREAVFKAITDPSLVGRWWGPKDYTTVVDKMDVRPGGVWRFLNRGPDGKEYAFNGVYREVIPPERLSYTFNFEPMPGHESLENITFEEENGRTKVTDRTVFQSIEDRDGMLKTGMETGAVESMNRFAELLKEVKASSEASSMSKEEFVITRVFNAPRSRVWKAWTDPEQLKQWWGPKNFTSSVAKIDLRVGGKYLNCMRSPDGKDFWSTGTYMEIVPVEKIVVTDSFADDKGNVVPATYYGMGPGFPLEALITMTFEDYQGKTKFTLRYSGIKDLNSADRMNMEQGWSETFDKLDEYFRKPEVLIAV
jgi:uncharacterized protein YndB with AHSA1/START domain